MKHAKKSFGFTSVFVCILTFLLFLSACGAAPNTASNVGAAKDGANNSANAGGDSKPAGSNATPQKLTDITFATLPVADSAAVILADKQGIFKKNGLNVKVVTVQTGPATTSAIVSGAAEFSQSNYATLISAKMKDVPIQIVAEAARAQEGFSAVITGTNSPIKEPKDLAGKRIATSVIGGIGPIAINLWLKEKGIDYTTINWVQMSFQEMGAAMETNRVDAAWVVEPFVTNYTKGKDAKARVVFDVFTGPTAKLPIAGCISGKAKWSASPD